MPQTIVPDAVRRQFDRRAQRMDETAFLLRDVEQRMLDRLSLVRLSPRFILDMGCGLGASAGVLQKRFPQSTWMGVDASENMVRGAREALRREAGWVRRMLNAARQSVMLADAGAVPLQDGCADLVWSNLMLHWHPQPAQVLREWLRLLAVDGLVMFSVLGPYTLREFRRQGSQDDAASWVDLPDMHDLGDMMVEAGYANPVVDMETLTLTYRSAEKAVHELRLLGGNPLRERRQGLRGRAWRQSILEAVEQGRGPDGNICITMEVAFGHAWKAAPRSVQARSGETTIPVSAIKRAPKPL